MPIFISHATADQALLEIFVELLQTGINIPQESIFCTSIDGLGIPEGQDFKSVLLQELSGADIVIMIITPRYYESYYCLCELGGSWALSKNAFPLIVPPLTYDDLKAVLSGVQAAYINQKNKLSALRDRLIKLGVGSGTTAYWETRRDSFIKKFEKLKVAGPSMVPYAKVEAINKSNEELKSALLEKEEEIEKLQEFIEKLKSCKNAEDVREVTAEFTGESEQFEKVCEAFRRSVEPLPRCVIEALYYHCKDGKWNPPDGFATEHIWDPISAAAEKGFLTVDGSTVNIDEDNPRVRKALKALNEVEVFFANASEDFKEAFADENEYQCELRNRDLWRDHLGL